MVNSALPKQACFADLGLSGCVVHTLPTWPCPAWAPCTGAGPHMLPGGACCPLACLDMLYALLRRPTCSGHCKALPLAPLQEMPWDAWQVGRVRPGRFFDAVTTLHVLMQCCHAGS
jgi:hypothetical protein